MKIKQGKPPYKAKPKIYRRPPVQTVSVDSVAMFLAILSVSQHSDGDFLPSLVGFMLEPQKDSAESLIKKIQPFLSSAIFLAALCYAFDRIQKAKEPDKLVSISYFAYRLIIAQGKKPTRQQSALIWEKAWQVAEQKKAVQEAITYYKKLDKGKRYLRAMHSRLAQWKATAQKKARSDFDYIFKKIQATVISKEVSLFALD